MGRIERHVEIPCGPTVALESADHVDVVVQLLERLLDPFPLFVKLCGDGPQVHPVPVPDHVQDFRLELRERAPRERREEQRDVFRADVPYAAVQEAALEDVARFATPQPLLVIEARRVIVHVEDHPGFEEPIEVFVQGAEVRELLVEEERLHLVLVEHLPRLAFPLEALEVPREHVLELLVNEEVARGDDALGLEVPQDLLHELRLEAQRDRELLRAVRPVDLEALREDLIQRLLEFRALRLAGKVDRFLNATAADEVRPLELTQGFVQVVLLHLREAREVFVGPRFFLDQAEHFLFRRLEPGPLRVHGDVRRHVVLQGPMDPLRRPYALDEAFVHELSRPLADVGEGGGGDLEDRAALLLQEVRVPDPVQVREEVLLPGDLRELAAEILDDLARLELNRADLVRRHDALEDLAVQLPQEGGAVLHEDEIGDALEDDVVGERGG